MNAKKHILIGIGCSVFAAILFGVYLVNLEQKYRGDTERVPVLVASRYIDQGAVITDKNTKEIKVPKEFLQPTSIASHKDIFSMEKTTYPVPVYMSILPIMEEEQIIASKLWMIGREAGLSMIIPSGMRAITLVFPRAEVSNVLMPGNFVDIMGIFEVGAEGRAEQTVATLVQNVQVLAVGRSMIGAAIQPARVVRRDRVETALVAEETAFEIPVTLAVTHEDAELISLAKKAGEGIHLAIRSPGDTSVLERGARLTIGKILGEAGRSAEGSEKRARRQPTVPREQIEAIERHKKEVEEMLRRHGR